MNAMIRNFIIALTASLFLSSCNDYLGVENKSTLNTDNFPATKEQCDLLLNSCYASPHFNGLYNWYWFPHNIYLHDHTSDLLGAWGERLSAQMNNTDVKMEQLEDFYVDIFKTIHFANMAVEGTEHYRKTASESELEGLDYIIGQALFFRVFGYWHGQIFFDVDPVNGRALPYYRSGPADLDEMTATPITTGEMWANMIEDLQKSKELIAKEEARPGHTYSKYRVSQWAVKGLLAKVYMQAAGKTNVNGYWEKAKEELKDIIDNSGKTLAAFDDYKRMFNGAPNEYEFGSESLFEVDMVTNPNQQGPYYGTFTMGGGMPMIFAPTFLELDKSKRVTDYKATVDDEGNYVNPNEKISLRSGWENNYIHDVNIRRFGFAGEATPFLELNPNLNWAEDLTIHNFPYRMKDSAVYVQNSIAAKAASDPRLTLCAAQPWVDTAIDDLGRTTLYGRAPSIGGDPNTSERYKILGWWHKKFTNLNGTEAASAKEPEHGKYLSSDANIPFIRLADIYLLYAEVSHNLNDDATALEYVNKVHRRAYGYPVDAGSPVDYASLNAATKTVAPDDELANDVIKYERWAELFAEGQWWWDVRRWQIGEEETRTYKTAAMGETMLTYNPDVYYTQPIPQAELDRNKGYKGKARGW